jgi:hypothetical protein
MMTARPPWCPLVILCALVAVGVSPAVAQDRFRTRVLLGAPAELDVDLEYHDPGELDRRLGGSAVLPIWVSATNVSGRPLSLSYADLRLDLGADGAGSATSIAPMDAGAARARLIRDGRYGPLVRLLGRGDRIVGEPFSPRFADGDLGPGQSRRGYVFFLRPEGVAFTGFMALGTAGRAAELLSTAAIDVPEPIATRGGPADAVQSMINALGPVLFGRPFGRSYAVLFGVAQYRSKRDLEMVRRDLANLTTYLTRQGFEPVVVKADAEVTVDTLKNIQRHFGGKLRAEDRLLVYYAGHGARLADRGYLVLSDSGDTVDPRTAVPMDQFVAWTRGLPVKHLLLILDACYSGSAVPGTTREEVLLGSIDWTDQKVLYQLASGAGKYVLMAGTEGQKAHEDKRWDGGLFTRALLRTLEARPSDGGRLITTHELYAAAKRFVIGEVAKHGLTPQLPVFKDISEPSQGEFVFVRPAR